MAWFLSWLLTTVFLHNHLHQVPRRLQELLSSDSLILMQASDDLSKG